MASRLRSLVILGPPLVVVAAVGATLRPVPQVIAGTLPTPARVADCPSTGSATGSATGAATGAATGSTGAATGAATGSTGAATAGTWWTQEARLDAAGTLTGWALMLGSPQGETLSVELPPASIVTGPTAGVVVAATDDGTGSAIQILEGPRQCSRLVSVEGAIVRRAILEPGRDGLIAHLLDRENRYDLGIWRISLDGLRRVPLLPPIADAVLASAGIDRVWATDLRLSGNGEALAVQSCDPQTCITRVLDLRSRRVTVLDEPHGAVIGFSGRFLLTEAACAGQPCDVLSWDLATRRSDVVATGASGAAVSNDGRLVVGIVDAEGATTAALIDPGTGRSQSLGRLEPGAAPQGPSGTTGIELPPNAIGLVRASGAPVLLVIDPPAYSDQEVEP
ncbi:MAG: hypothetical protein HYX54_09330 [Chloroflexi bacterium]|nr:hypothetical protein [Chloroflexota bacterium]